MRRIKLTVEYDGTHFKGWQRQTEFPDTVQGNIERVLKDMTGKQIDTYVAGRTDAGVHAKGQVCHFDVDNNFHLLAFKEGINSLTPFEISILKAEHIDPDFHSRFSAQDREYEFLIYNRREHSAIHLHRAVHISWPLDIEKMKRAAEMLVGELDFAGFRSAECSSNVTFCRMRYVKVEEYGEFIRIRLRANHFLHNMCRILCGTLVDIGRGKLPEDHMKHVLETKDRTQAGVTLPPHGLYFIKAHYDDFEVYETV